MLVCLTDWKTWKLSVPAAVHPVLSKLVESITKHLVTAHSLHAALRAFLLNQQLLQQDAQAVWLQAALTIVARPLSIGIGLPSFTAEFAVLPALTRRLGCFLPACPTLPCMQWPQCTHWPELDIPTSRLFSARRPRRSGQYGRHYSATWPAGG